MFTSSSVNALSAFDLLTDLSLAMRFFNVCFDLPDISLLGIELLVVDDAYGTFAFKTFLASSFCLRNFSSASRSSLSVLLFLDVPF